MEFLHINFVNGYTEDDILLEFVMLMSAICRTDAIANLIAESSLIQILQDLLGAKQEDDEMVQ